MNQAPQKSAVIPKPAVITVRMSRAAREVIGLAAASDNESVNAWCVARLVAAAQTSLDEKGIPHGDDRQGNAAEA